MDKVKLFDEGIEIEVVENEVAIKTNTNTFLLTLEEIEEHLNERWMEDESNFIEIEGQVLELFPTHYRYLKQKIEEAI